MCARCEACPREHESSSREDVRFMFVTRSTLWQLQLDHPFSGANPTSGAAGKGVGSDALNAYERLCKRRGAYGRSLHR